MAKQRAGMWKNQHTMNMVNEDAAPEDVPDLNSGVGVEVTEKPVLSDGVVASEAVEAAVEPPVESNADRDLKAKAIIKHYTKWAAGVGIVPIPLLDAFTMSAVQMSMVRKLAELYDIPYNSQIMKSAVAGLIGGVNAAYLGGSALKMFPVLGVFTLAAMPAINAAINWAVGKVFIQHFESGGTFLDFDPAKVKAYFEEQYREGKLKLK